MPGACFHSPTWAGSSRYLYEVSLVGPVLGTAQRAVVCLQSACKRNKGGTTEAKLFVL